MVLLLISTGQDEPVSLAYLIIYVDSDDLFLLRVVLHVHFVEVDLLEQIPHIVDHFHCLFSRTVPFSLFSLQGVQEFLLVLEEQGIFLFIVQAELVKLFRRQPEV